MQAFTLSEQIQRKACHQLKQSGDMLFKAAVLRTSSCAVGLSVRYESHSDSDSSSDSDSDTDSDLSKTQPVAYDGTGTIIECENDGDGKFSTSIVTNAKLFRDTKAVQLSDIEVKVYLANGDLYKGSVLARDFHYELAVVIFHSDTLLQTANLRDLDDVMSIQVDDAQSSQLLRHSSSFKISPGDMVAALSRSSSSSGITVTYGRFRYPSLQKKNDGCKELYSFETEHEPRSALRYIHTQAEEEGGPVINRHGEVIGFTTGATRAIWQFLPSNIVSRWWNSYKQHNKLCQPCIGVNVDNLQAASFQFLERFVREFPTVFSGLIVTEVMKKSPAYNSGLRNKDVIVQCNGATVRSTLDFFDKIWDKVGSSVELSILRLECADHINLTVQVQATTQDHKLQGPVAECLSEHQLSKKRWTIPLPSSHSSKRLKPR